MAKFCWGQTALKKSSFEKKFVFQKKVCVSKKCLRFEKVCVLKKKFVFQKNVCVSKKVCVSQKKKVVALCYENRLCNEKSLSLYKNVCKTSVPSGAP